VRKFIWAALALSLVAIPSRAQETPVSDVSVGYSFFHSSGASLNGVSGSAAWYLNDWLGIAGDLGAYYGSPGGASATALTYTVGPRFSIRRSDRVVPFAEALVGGSHLSASFGGLSGSVNPLAFGGGGGAEIAISSSGRLLLRPEVEYFGLRTGGATANCVRISVGISYRIGSRSR
jgi:outer membrane protein with beta-barrel domain